jgi:hypothetical protein
LFNNLQFDTTLGGNIFLVAREHIRRFPNFSEGEKG